MHEYGLIKRLIRRVEEVAAAEHARRVTKVSVWLGALSHFSPGHFAEHFETAAVGSVAEGAEVDCETSDDIYDPKAAEAVLLGVEVET